MYAPFCHHDFVEPTWPDGGAESLEAPHRLIVQSGGMLTAFEMSHDPFDVVLRAEICWHVTNGDAHVLEVLHEVLSSKDTRATQCSTPSFQSRQIVLQ